jgi:hypothetical protein
MSSINFKNDGTVQVSRSDGYTYIIKDGGSSWRYVTGGDESLELIPLNLGLRKPPPEPSAPVATQEQMDAYNQSLSMRKLAILGRILKERKQNSENSYIV